MIVGIGGATGLVVALRSLDAVHVPRFLVCVAQLSTGDAASRWHPLARDVLRTGHLARRNRAIIGPALGLHPYALEVLAQLIKEAAQRTQLVISTQSAPLLNLFEPQEVVVVERVEGASHFRRLEAEPLAEWLKDYALGELLEQNVIEAVRPMHRVLIQLPIAAFQFSMRQCNGVLQPRRDIVLLPR